MLKINNINELNSIVYVFLHFYKCLMNSATKYYDGLRKNLMKEIIC